MNQEDKMKQKVKRKVTKLLGVAGVLALTASIGTSTLFASAAFNSEDFVADGHKYKSDYESTDELLEAGRDTNLELAEEGFVLLKNRENALPMAKTAKVTVLGATADTLSTGGGGSGAQKRPTLGNSANTIASQEENTLFESLDAVGIEVNPTVKALYEKQELAPANGVDQLKYMELSEAAADSEFAGKNYAKTADNVLASAESSFKDYSDAAIILISRTGSEGDDNPTYEAPGHADKTDHYLELTDSEEALVAYAKMHFDKIVFIVNSPSVMELGDLQDDDAVSAVIWIGQPGWNGIMALGEILVGNVNPSGRTVDFYMRRFESDPTWYNFGPYAQANYALNGKLEMPGGENQGGGFGGSGTTIPMNSDAYSEEDWSEIINNTGRAVDYAEGIYMGYRYYETVATDLNAADTDGEEGNKAGDQWYAEEVVYPFGYGLSYTSFTQEITEVTGDLTNADGQISVKVKVTNTGAVADKEVVQLYSTPPQKTGEGAIDKAAVNLVGFEKTDSIAPGASDEVTVSIAVKDLASFDQNAVNQDLGEGKTGGYVLETGDYVLSIRKDSHSLANEDETKSTKTLTCSTALGWDEDGNPATPNNIFSQTGEENEWSMYNVNANAWTVSGEDHYLHRSGLLNEDKTAPSDLTALSWLLTDDNEFKDAAFNVMELMYNNSVDADFDNPMTVENEDDFMTAWAKVKEDMEGLTQGAGTKDADGMYETKLYDMIGKAYDDAAWDDFLDQVTWEEMVSVVTSGSFSNTGLASIGKPQLSDVNGPIQLGSGWAWVVAPVVASTWNKELANRQGEIIGNESLWQGGVGWYGPGLNTHRNPLSGRNFEYYSQDGIQGGLIAAAVIKGATDYGCHVYMKHCFMNDQETMRFESNMFTTEQAMREIYAKQFEIAVKKGNCDGIMLSFNHIGVQSSASYALNTQLYTNEWGYRGYTVTDMHFDGIGWTGWNMMRGLTMPLGSVSGEATGVVGTWDAAKNCVVVDGEESYTQWYWTRELFKRACFETLNSNGMLNGLDVNEVLSVEDMEVNRGSSVKIETINSSYDFGAVFENGYSIEVSGLPEGLSANSAGVITGVPTEKGKFTVTVTVSGKGDTAYISGSASFVLTVGPLVTLSNMAPIAGEAFSATLVTPVTLTEDNYNPDATPGRDTVGIYTSVSYAAEGLPEGLTLNAETGEITGTPAEEGEYNLTLTVTYKKIARSGGGRRPSYKLVDEVFASEITLTVKAEAESITIEIIDGYWYINGENTGISAIGPVGPQGPAGQDGADGADGADGQDGAPGKDGVGIESMAINDKGELVVTYTDGTSVNLGVVVGADGADGADGQDGAPGKDAEGGCNSSVGTTAATAVFTFAAVALMIALFRRKRADK